MKVNTPEAYGKSMAESMFQFFLEPEMQGPNFTWARFPQIVARLARIQYFTACRMPPSDEQKERAAAAAEARAYELLNDPSPL